MGRFGALFCVLMLSARKLALNSWGVFGKPGSHLLVGPGPFKGMGVAVVVFGPRGRDVGLELLPALPRRPCQVVVLERVDEDLRLVQPRGVGGGISGPPPAPAPGEITARAARDMTGAAVLDQEDA